MNRKHKMFTGFGPQVSASSLKAMRQKISELRIRRRTHIRLAVIAREINPILQGWLNYYGRYWPSGMHSVWKYVNATLIAWAMRKYKRYNRRKIQAGQMVRGPLPTSGANCSYTGIKVLSARLPDGSGVS